MTLGIIAGGGQFPRLIAAEAAAAGNKVAICGFHGHTDPALEQQGHAFCLLHLGQFNKLIEFFHSQGVERLCMAGAINKPRALDFRPDLRAAKIVFSLRKKGDDSLLRAILRELEGEGFAVLSAGDLVPGLRCPAGNLTRGPIPEETLEDMRFGWPLAQDLGRHDMGQCVVVRQGMVTAVECLEGTDAALKRGAELGGKGCVAVKRVKPGQDERVDLPSVGLQTIQTLVEHNYSGLIIQAQKTLFFDREASINLAQKHKIHVLALGDEDALP